MQTVSCSGSLQFQQEQIICTYRQESWRKMIGNDSTSVVSLQARLSTMTNQEGPKDELAVDKWQLLAKPTLHHFLFAAKANWLWSHRHHDVQLNSACKLLWQKASSPTRAEGAPQVRKAAYKCINKRKINPTSQTHSKTHLCRHWQSSHKYAHTKRARIACLILPFKSQGDRMHLIYAWLQNCEKQLHNLKKYTSSTNKRCCHKLHGLD